MSEATLEKKQKQEVQALGNSPIAMLRAAKEAGIEPKDIQGFLDVQVNWEKREAEKAYVQAMADFKANAPKVTKDKKNLQYKSMYTTLGNLVNTVNPELSKHGLSASWDIFQNGIIKVTCKMTHKLGHSQTAEASAPADTSGAKNPIQQIKSTITYLKAVTFESICGLASTEANLDDDGNSAGTEVTIDEKQAIAVNEYLDSLKIDKAKFLKFFKVESVEDLPKARYQEAIGMLKAREGKK